MLTPPLPLTPGVGIANNLETRDKPCDGDSDVASVPVQNSIKIIQGFLQYADKIV